MSTAIIDRIWQQVKAIQGEHEATDDFDRGCDCGLEHALIVIARHGGMSLEARAAEERDRNEPTGPWPRPGWYRPAQGDDPEAA